MWFLTDLEHGSPWDGYNDDTMEDDGLAAVSEQGSLKNMKPVIKTHK